MTYSELLTTCQTKTLVYFCVFSNPDYIKLLKLLFTSIVLYTEDLSQIDLLVFTSKNLQEEILQLARSLNISIDTYIFDFTGKDQALCSRLYIFEYPLTQLYRQVLYLDTDIIIQSDINGILQGDLEEKIYGVQEGTIGHEWWGAELFDFTKIDRNITAINSGILLFRPTDMIKSIFTNIRNDIKYKSEKAIPLPVCPDQSYINYYFIKDAIYNNTYLTEYTKFYSKGADLNIIHSNNILCHFTWPIGNALNKLERMTIFLKKIISNISSRQASLKLKITDKENTLYNLGVSRIPKIFFQKSRDTLPKYIRDMIQYCLSDGWTYHNFVNGDELPFFQKYPLSQFPDIINVFNSIKNGANKAELFRYYFLYINGGVYMDSDAMIYQPIDSIVKDYAFFSINSWVPNTISNCVIAAEKGNPIILEALTRLYNTNIGLLDNDFHYICKDLYKIYISFENTNIKMNNILFNEISDPTGDRLVDSSGRTLFKHFWRNKENIPNHLWTVAKPIESRSKNLIYFCVFYNNDYFKLLDLLLSSMKFFSSLEGFDLVVLTSPDMEQSVHELCTKFQMNIHIMPCNFTTIFQAACARLYIFDYEHIGSYERILYLDTDIIIKADLTPLFAIELRDVLYGLEQGSIAMPNFGSQFFDLKTINSGKTGLNSGTLLFKNCLAVRDLFSRIKGHIQAFTDSAATIPYTMDQPFINYHAIKSDLYDNKALNQYVSLYEGSDEVANYETSIVCHFSYPIGNFGHKHHRMKEFLIGLLEKSNSKKANQLALVGKSYSWSSYGYIAFKESCVLETKWGKGTYQILENGLVRAIWNNHYHILKFSDDYSGYSSLRTGPRDLDLTSGFSKA